MDNIYAYLEEPTIVAGDIRKVSWHSEEKVQIRQVLQHLTFLQPTIELFNISFNLRQDDEYVYLESPQWPSLQSYGRTVQEAISDMLGLIRSVIQEYVLVPESELASDAIEFRRFLIQKLLV